MNDLAMEELQYLCSLPTGTRYIVGFTRWVGSGRLTYLGLQPTAQLIAALYPYLNISIPARSLTPGITTALYSRKDQTYLMIVNTGVEAKAAELRLDPGRFAGKKLLLKELVSKKEWSAFCEEGLLLLPSIPGKDAAVYRIQTSER